ncbi:DNA cytosine methyltransferase [Micromonospora sp. NPDC005367]|uniref:DNA cytosine methyltransferase n=1 Tax=Micromonospora sp. NPDC005367 TaxID=3155590 RepID=UPI0033B6DA44
MLIFRRPRSTRIQGAWTTPHVSRPVPSTVRRCVIDQQASPRIGSLCTGHGGLDWPSSWCSAADAPGRRDRPTRAHRPGPPLARCAQPRRHPHRRLDPRRPGRHRHRRIPCQDISNAGKRACITSEQPLDQDRRRHSALRPALVFVENVAALSRRGLDVVHADLTAIRYDTRWLCRRASDIGAAHRREPLFLLATPQRHSPRARTLPTPCARDGKGPRHPHPLTSIGASGWQKRAVCGRARWCPTQ